MQNFEEFFDGTLGTWKTYPVKFELKKDAKSKCLKPYPVPKAHREIFKKEVERLVLLAVLEKSKNSEWGAPSFSQPKPK